MFNERKIEEIIEQALKRKIERYNPESNHRPFHDKLLGEDKDGDIFFHPVHEYYIWYNNL